MNSPLKITFYVPFMGFRNVQWILKFESILSVIHHILSTYTNDPLSENRD